MFYRFTKFVEGSLPKTILQLEEFLRLRQEVVNELEKKKKPESGGGVTFIFPSVSDPLLLKDLLYSVFRTGKFLMCWSLCNNNVVCEAWLLDRSHLIILGGSLILYGCQKNCLFTKFKIAFIAASGEGEAATGTENESAPPGMDAPPGEEAPPGAENDAKVSICR